MDACYEVPAHLRDSGALAPDSCGVPAPACDQRASLASRADESLWLPQGHHWDLHIEHDHQVQTGPFVAAAKRKPLWHITVSGWDTVDIIRRVLHDKAAEVHFVIGGRAGVEHPVVIQCLPLNQYGKGVMHPAGTPETNRAGGIQVEICATEASIQSFTHYKALANLFVLIQHRVPLSNTVSRSFANRDRFSGAGYAAVRGHHGHMHVPNNNHVDPTPGMKSATLARLIREIPDGGYSL